MTWVLHIARCEDRSPASESVVDLKAGQHEPQHLDRGLSRTTKEVPMCAKTLTTWLAVCAAISGTLEVAAAEKPTDKQVCAAGIAAMMGRDPKTVRTTRVDGDVYLQQYARPDDGTVWKYKCTIEGNRVMWGADDGRWRRHPNDEVMTFEWAGDTLTVREKGFLDDKPRVLKAYKASQLPKK